MKSYQGLFTVEDKVIRSIRSSTDENRCLIVGDEFR